MQGIQEGVVFCSLINDQRRWTSKVALSSCSKGLSATGFPPPSLPSLSMLCSPTNRPWGAEEDLEIVFIRGRKRWREKQAAAKSHCRLSQPHRGCEAGTLLQGYPQSRERSKVFSPLLRLSLWHVPMKQCWLWARMLIPRKEHQPALQPLQK